LTALSKEYRHCSSDENGLPKCEMGLACIGSSYLLVCKTVKGPVLRDANNEFDQTLDYEARSAAIPPVSLAVEVGDCGVEVEVCTVVD